MHQSLLRANILIDKIEEDSDLFIVLFLLKILRHNFGGINILMATFLSTEKITNQKCFDRYWYRNSHSKKYWLLYHISKYNIAISSHRRVCFVSCRLQALRAELALNHSLCGVKIVFCQITILSFRVLTRWIGWGSWDSGGGEQLRDEPGWWTI